MKIFIIVAVISVFTSGSALDSKHSIDKRVLPTDKNCDPDTGKCRKGDWTAKDIADCEYDGPISCDAENDHLLSWTVDVAEGDRCIPKSGTRFRCGASGTNTRCVCSDTNWFYNPGFNECRCQYWPQEDVGSNSLAFCTGYYAGGRSQTFGISGDQVHHWACCNNCNDQTSNTCDSRTWQGGSPIDYCSSCGQNIGGGRVKYYFNCGNCGNQQDCADSCASRNYAGLCWDWLDCFQDCCLKSTTQPRTNVKRDVSELSFCGDNTCSENESPTSCPSDCCYQVNSMICTHIPNKCRPECCQTSNCCLEVESDDQGNSADDQDSGAIVKKCSTFILLLFTIISLF